MLAIIAAAAFIAGCAAFRPPFPQYEMPDKACISGGNAHLLRMLAGEEAHIMIRQIDDIDAGTVGPYCVRPGLRKVTIHTQWSGRYRYQGSIMLDAKPGTTYQFTSDLRSDDRFLVRALDTTTNPPTVVLEKAVP
jgi:hypothetical protein